MIARTRSVTMVYTSGPKTNIRARQCQTYVSIYCLTDSVRPHKPCVVLVKHETQRGTRWSKPEGAYWPPSGASIERLQRVSWMKTWLQHRKGPLALKGRDRDFWGKCQLWGKAPRGRGGWIDLLTS